MKIFLFAPYTVYKTLGSKTASQIVLLLVTVLLILQCIPTKENAAYSEGDVIVFGILFATCLLATGGVFYCIEKLPIQRTLGEKPWKTDADKAFNDTSIKCPFTGGEAVVQCTSCKSLVAEDAFHLGDVVGIFGTKFILNGFDATEALEDENAFEGRIALDEAVDLTADLIAGGVAPCCIGCRCYYRCWKSFGKLVVLFSLASMMTVLFPFTINFSALIDDSLRIRQASAFVSACFAGAALLISLKLVGESLVFIDEFGGRIGIRKPFNRALDTSLAKFCMNNYGRDGAPVLSSDITEEMFEEYQYEISEEKRKNKNTSWKENFLQALS